MSPDRISRRQFGMIAAAGMAGGLVGSRLAAATDIRPFFRLASESVIEDQALNFAEGPWGTCTNRQASEGKRLLPGRVPYHVTSAPVPSFANQSVAPPTRTQILSAVSLSSAVGTESTVASTAVST